MSHDEIALEEEFARVPLKRSVLRRLMGYLGPQRGPLTWALILEIVWVCSMLLELHLMKVAVDGPLAERDVHGMWIVAGWFVANIVFRVFLTMYELRLTTRAGTPRAVEVQ